MAQVCAIKRFLSLSIVVADIHSHHRVPPLSFPHLLFCHTYCTIASLEESDPGFFLSAFTFAPALQYLHAAYKLDSDLDNENCLRIRRCTSLVNQSPQGITRDSPFPSQNFGNSARKYPKVVVALGSLGYDELLISADNHRSRMWSSRPYHRGCSTSSNPKANPI